MIKKKYIHDTLMQRWKYIDSGESITLTGWDDSMQGFIVDSGSGDLTLHTFDDFFNTFVIESNERVWSYANDFEKSQKNSAGWLCVMNGISIFNQFDGVSTQKESMVLSSYVKERIDDVHYSTKNNLQPPWLEEKAHF